MSLRGACGVHGAQSVDDLDHDGAHITFHDVHRPLAAYFAALEAGRFLVEALREPIPGADLLGVHPTAARWTSTPCVLHFRARKRG